MGTEDYTLCSNDPDTGSYDEPDEFSKIPKHCTFKMHFDILLTSVPLFHTSHFRFSVQNSVCISHLSQVGYVLRLYHFTSYDSPNNI
jgi:hypothetical protein